MSEPVTTVWVIEDSPTQALHLQITLEAQGWTTWWAATAEDALERLNEGLPDLVLVDLNLPGISGDEFARRVRMSMRTRNLALLILTDSDSAESQRRGFESGADDYVPKSTPSDVLLLRNLDDDPAMELAYCSNTQLVLVLLDLDSGQQTPTAAVSQCESSSGLPRRPGRGRASARAAACGSPGTGSSSPCR